MKKDQELIDEIHEIMVKELDDRETKTKSLGG